MTIGEKIKYCRKQIGITQDKLAELTGIHPVSIRKYETNKMQPQPPQLEKIAAALGVSYNALNGSDAAALSILRRKLLSAHFPCFFLILNVLSPLKPLSYFLQKLFPDPGDRHIRKCHIPEFQLHLAPRNRHRNCPEIRQLLVEVMDPDAVKIRL